MAPKPEPGRIDTAYEACPGFSMALPLKKVFTLWFRPKSNHSILPLKRSVILVGHELGSY